MGQPDLPMVITPPKLRIGFHSSVKNTGLCFQPYFSTSSQAVIFPSLWVNFTRIVSRSSGFPRFPGLCKLRLPFNPLPDG